MRIGHYYHIPCAFQPDGSARLPSMWGSMIKELAELSGQTATVFAHRLDEPTELDDMTLGAPHVRWVDLGPRGSAPARLLRPGAVIDRFAREVADVDVMFVQGPTPLLPHLVRASGDALVVLLIGGDYGSWVPQSRFGWMKNTAIKALMRLYVHRQRRAARGRLTYIQNPTLEPSVRGAEIRFSTFSTVPRSATTMPTVDPAWPAGTGTTEPVKLLYSGRIVRDKGVLEVVEALALLRDRGYNATFDLLGWTEDGDPIGQTIEELAKRRGVWDRVSFRGYVPAGSELMARYRDAHVFVMATYWDSFPRSMQEAMAAGLPVIATPVGGIGYYLEDQRTALFVEPRTAEPIADAVAMLVDDEGMRRRLATQGHAWSSRHSLEAECESIMGEVAGRFMDAAGRT